MTSNPQETLKILCDALLSLVCFSAGLTSGFSDSNHQTKSKTVDNIFIYNNRDSVAQKSSHIVKLLGLK